MTYILIDLAQEKFAEMNASFLRQNPVKDCEAKIKANDISGVEQLVIQYPHFLRLVAFPIARNDVRKLSSRSSLLGFASAKSSASMVRMLLSRGADINFTDRESVSSKMKMFEMAIS